MSAETAVITSTLKSWCLVYCRSLSKASGNWAARTGHWRIP